MVSVVSWNVAGRVSAVPAQAAALAGVDADVVALQEVRATAVAAWTAALAAHGYDVVTSLPAGLAAADPLRRLGVLVASRGKLRGAGSLTLPWPERHLLVDMAHLRLLNIHAPTSQKDDQVKVRTLEEIARFAAEPQDRPVVICGDLNTPQYESREGEVRSFARTRAGRIRPTHGERHDAAELAVVPGLRDHGFADAFRAVNGYGARDRSWMYANRKMGYRLDHCFVRGLRPVSSRYLHEWREARLSDHSGLLAELA